MSQERFKMKFGCIGSNQTARELSTAYLKSIAFGNKRKKKPKGRNRGRRMLSRISKLIQKRNSASSASREKELNLEIEESKDIYLKMGGSEFKIQQIEYQAFPHLPRPRKVIKCGQIKPNAKDHDKGIVFKKSGTLKKRGNTKEAIRERLVFKITKLIQKRILESSISSQKRLSFEIDKSKDIYFALGGSEDEIQTIKLLTIIFLSRPRKIIKGGRIKPSAKAHDKRKL